LYKPKDAKTGIDIKGEITNNQKISFSGKYQCPSRMEKDKKSAISVKKISTRILNSLLTFLFLLFKKLINVLFHSV